MIVNMQVTLYLFLYVYVYLYLYYLLKYPLHTLEAVAALPRYTSCDATLFQPLKSTAHHRPHVDHSDDDAHDDNDDDDDDDDLTLLVWSNIRLF